MEECILSFVGNPKGKRPGGRPKRRWKESIEVDLREIGWKGVWTRFVWPRPVAGSCEHGNELSGFINGEFLEWLSDWRLLKKDSAAWN
jgi:hypothetical protein